MQDTEEENRKVEIADLNANLLKEIEGKTTDTLVPNDNLLLSQSQEDEIALLLQNCSTDWQQMIESEDLTVLKTLETYNAIHRIPVSLIHHHVTVTVDDYEIQGMTALHMAAVKGNTEMIRLLLLHPAIDVNAVDENGSTPLHVACKIKGNVEVVKVLLTAPRIDVNMADMWGYTPLYNACRYGQHVEVIRMLLLDERVDVNKTNHDGWTPLNFACCFGRVEVVKFLLSGQRIDVNKANNWGWTPLHGACCNDHVEVVRILLRDGRVDMNKTDKDGETPLSVAKTEEIRALLKAKGAI